ncbi:hypothetical protein MNV49_001956 [Pseudohyphozyma bogoriensis]|nr:hypothetical protein MNV49_001956 [Pseudohyphozyma bogoriensis]
MAGLFTKNLLASPSTTFSAVPEADAVAKQPPLVSLFSSTSSHPLALATAISASPSLTDDSFISIISDSSSSSTSETVLAWHGDPSSAARVLRAPPPSTELDLAHRVLHLQSPDIKRTFVRWGSRKGKERERDELGIALPFVHLAVKDVQQAFFVDVGVVDSRGQRSVIHDASIQHHLVPY